MQGIPEGLPEVLQAYLSRLKHRLREGWEEAGKQLVYYGGCFTKTCSGKN